jgi:hypothetical protein
VETLRRCLRHASPPEDVARAIERLTRTPRWIRSLTGDEAGRLSRHAPPGSEALLAQVRTILSGDPAEATCTRCGRYTVRGWSCSVLHGNPATPASDTEVEWSGACTSCGAGRSERA